MSEEEWRESEREMKKDVEEHEELYGALAADEDDYGMVTDIHVDRHANWSNGQITIYDRFGVAGDIQLSIEDAKHVRDQLNRVLDDGD